MEKTFAIIPAAGRGVRMGYNRPKQFLDLDGKPILAHTLETFCRMELITGIILVVPEPCMQETWDLLGDHFRLSVIEGQEGDSWARLDDWYRLALSPNASESDVHPPKLIRMVVGGAERQDSVYNGLKHLPQDCSWVMIHDGVRPFASPDLIRRAWTVARDAGACIAALPSTDTVKRVLDGKVAETLARDTIWLVQTPQVFARDLILAAYEEARRRGWVGTDDASFVERSGHAVAVTPGERSNIKVTTPEDLEWGKTFLSKCSKGQAASAG